MQELNWIGKALIFFGVIFVIVGLGILAVSKLPWFGRLPGDILIQRKNFVFFFPLTTCILISLILSLIFYFLSRR